MSFSYCPLLSQSSYTKIFTAELQIKANGCKTTQLVIKNINKHLIEEVIWLKDDSILLGRSTKKRSGPKFMQTIRLCLIQPK